MCGIAGKFIFDGLSTVNPDLLQNMIGIVNHRGPDECGYYIDDNIGLGHARLSIIDLSGGTQPIHNENKTLWIVYNGEVFNYIELRNELQKKGHSFYTSSDTEVILHLYEDLGENCLDRLNGQFVFAIWDRQKKELFVARDRVGIRPLFYTSQNNSLVFASEIKSIFMDKTIPRKIDFTSLNQIFTFWSTLNRKTFFKNICELPPGHYLKASAAGDISVHQYWDIPFCAPEEQSNMSFERIAEEAGALFQDAVKIRLRADVPVGCYLSGGLDSSGISACVANKFNHNVKTFGIRFHDNAFDEGYFQQRMVASLGTEHADITVTNDDINNSLSDTLWHVEKPLLRAAPVPLFLLSKLVQQHQLKVVLTGEGADEIFGGYNIFREAKVRNFWAKNPNSKIRGLLIARLYPYIFKDTRLGGMQLSFFKNGLEKYSDPLFSHCLRWNNTGKTRQFLSDEALSSYDQEEEYENIKRKLPADFNKWDYLAKAQYLEMKIFLNKYLLSSQGDRVAMAHSLEMRMPFLDFRLIEFMGRVPAEYKIRGLNEKYLLKKVLAPSLPDEIVNRPKQPYRAPFGSSIVNSSNKQLINSVSERSLQQTGIFNATKVMKFINRSQSKKALSEVDTMALMGVYSSQLIFEKFIDNFPDGPCLGQKPALCVDMRHNPKVA